MSALWINPHPLFPRPSTHHKVIHTTRHHVGPVDNSPILFPQPSQVRNTRPEARGVRGGLGEVGACPSIPQQAKRAKKRGRTTHESVDGPTPRELHRVRRSVIHNVLVLRTLRRLSKHSEHGVTRQGAIEVRPTLRQRLITVLPRKVYIVANPVVRWKDVKYHSATNASTAEAMSSVSGELGNRYSTNLSSA